MVKAISGNIIQANYVEVIFIPSTAIGRDFEEYEEILAQHAGPSIGADTKRYFQSRRGKLIEEGTCYSTTPGLLGEEGIKKVYHLVIQSYPNTLTSYKIITDALHKSYLLAIKDGISSIGLPAIGCGISGIDCGVVARIIVRTALNYSHKIDTYIIERESFINEINRILD